MYFITARTQEITSRSDRDLGCALTPGLDASHGMKLFHLQDLFKDHKGGLRLERGLGKKKKGGDISGVEKNRF